MQYNSKSLRRSFNQLLEAVHIHILLQQGDHVGIESLPVRIVEVVLLRRLLQVSLDDREVLLIVDGLHHEPGQGLLVLGVDGRRLKELGVKLGDGLLVRLSAEV